MALDDILDKINKDAQEEIQELEEEYNQKIEELEQEFEQWKEERLEDAETKAKKAKTKKYNKLVRSKESELRKKLLTQKQQMLQQVFEEAKEKLLNMDKSEYRTTFINILTSLDVQRGTIYAGRKEQESFNDEFVNILEEKKEDGDFELEYSEDFERGLIIQTGSVRYVLTIPSIFKEIREKLEDDIIEKIFPEE